MSDEKYTLKIDPVTRDLVLDDEGVMEIVTGDDVSAQGNNVLVSGVGDTAVGGVMVPHPASPQPVDFHVGAILDQGPPQGWGTQFPLVGP